MAIHFIRIIYIIDDVTFIIGKVERAWENECERAKKANCMPKFIRALFYAYKFDFLKGSFLSFLEVLLVVCQVRFCFIFEKFSCVFVCHNNIPLLLII